MFLKQLAWALPGPRGRTTCKPFLPTPCIRLCTTCNIRSAPLGDAKHVKTSRSCSGCSPLPLQLPHGELERVPGFTAGEDPPEALPSDQNGGRHVPVHETVCRWSSVADKEGSLRVNQFIPKTPGALKDLFWVGKWSHLNLPLQRQVHFDIF